MNKDEKLKLCKGCHQDHYNQPGNSRTGECWSLETAKPAKMTQVGTWQNPPYKWEPQKTLSCHTAPEGCHWILKNDVRILR